MKPIYRYGIYGKMKDGHYRPTENLFGFLPSQLIRNILCFGVIPAYRESLFEKRFRTSLPRYVEQGRGQNDME